MEQIADFGVAAHWKYKDPKKIKEKDSKEYKWMHDLVDLMNNSTSQDELLENSLIFKVDLKILYQLLNQMGIEPYIHRLWDLKIKK